MLNILFTGPVMNGKTIAGVRRTMRVLYCTPYDYSIIILDILATMGKISRISLWGTREGLRLALLRRAGYSVLHPRHGPED